MEDDDEHVGGILECSFRKLDCICAKEAWDILESKWMMS